MLVNKLRPRPFNSFPDFLLKDEASRTHCPLEMSKIFSSFYRKLYNCLQPENHFNFTKEKFDAYFEGLSLPKLSTSDLADLNAPITAEELLSTINYLPPHKSPGPDGLPYIYYKTFFYILAPHLLALYSTFLKGQSLHSHFSHSYISVIPKPGKDPSLPDNY